MGLDARTGETLWEQDIEPGDAAPVQTDGRALIVARGSARDGLVGRGLRPAGRAPAVVASRQHAQRLPPGLRARRSPHRVTSRHAADGTTPTATADVLG